MSKAKVLTTCLVVAGLVLAQIAAFTPQVKAQPAVTGFFLNEVAYAGNANVSDLFTNSANYIRFNGSVYSDTGEPTVTAHVWHTVGNCLPGGGGGCSPSNLKVAEFNVPLTPSGEPGYYTFTNVPISGMIKPFTDGSWVAQITVSEEAQITGESGYEWFWIETRSPNTPELVSPANTSTRDVGSVTFDWNEVEDFLPPSGLRSGVQKCFFELYSDGGLNTLVYQAELTSGSSVEVSNLGEGTYYWRVRALDNVGNYGDWSSAWAVTLDAGEEPGEEPDDEPGDEEPPTEGDDSLESDIPDDLTTSAHSHTSSPTPPPLGVVSGTSDVVAAEDTDSVSRAGRILSAFAPEAEAAGESEGEVLGATEEDSEEEECTAENYAWWLPLLVAALVSLIMGILARRGKRAWIVLPIIIAVVAQLVHWIWWGCNCATSGWCDWYWLINLIILILGLIYYGIRTRPEPEDL